MTDEEAAGLDAAKLDMIAPPALKGMKFRMQVGVMDCLGCGNCVDVCPGKKGNKALKMVTLESQLDEAKKKLAATDQTLSQDRNSLGLSDIGSDQASIESPWGYGRRISSRHNAAVTNKLMKEVDTLSAKRNNQAQDVIALQLKLEAAQKTLDELLKKN